MSHRWSELESRASNEVIIPAWMRQLVSVVATASAAILYAIVLGIAVYRTFTEGQPQFSETMTRAAAALSGLVGSVVTAGFARGGSAAAI
ncbi:MAG: hypothetical protein GXY79_08925 [Chloroflexi bacterium]|nr:hypothetical protein [Chloroflexota bacterium]